MSQPSKSPSGAGPRTPADGVDQAMSVLSYLLGGLIVYGGLGWGGAHFLHVMALLPIGIVLGTGLSVYLIVRHYGSPGKQATSDWIEQRKTDQARWAQIAGRPPELDDAAGPDATPAAPARTGDAAGAAIADSRPAQRGRGSR